MARDQLFGPSLDQVSRSRLRDYAAADMGLLRSIDARHHALMSGWGGPPTVRACSLTSAGTYSVPYRVPPGVDYIDLGLRMGGATTAVITTAQDATGTLLTTRTNWVAASGYEQSIWARTGGLSPSDATAYSGRAIRVATAAQAASFAWSTIDLTIVVSAYAGGTIGGVFAIEFAPIRRRI